MLAEFGLPERVTAVLVVIDHRHRLCGDGRRRPNLVARRFLCRRPRRLRRVQRHGDGGRVLFRRRLHRHRRRLLRQSRAAGLAIAVGWAGGFVILAIAVAPYYRKSGAVTLPDLLAVRFGNPLVRILGGDRPVACSLPLLAAAIAIAGRVAGFSLHIAPEVAVVATCVVLLLSSLFGGMRGVTLVAGAQAIVILFGVVDAVAGLLRSSYTACRSPSSPTATPWRDNALVGGAADRCLRQRPVSGVVARRLQPLCAGALHRRRRRLASPCAGAQRHDERASPRPGSRRVGGWSSSPWSRPRRRRSPPSPSSRFSAKSSVSRSPTSRNGFSTTPRMGLVEDLRRRGRQRSPKSAPPAAPRRVVNGLAPGDIGIAARGRHPRLRRHHRAALCADRPDRRGGAGGGARHGGRGRDRARHLRRPRHLRHVRQPAGAGRPPALRRRGFSSSCSSPSAAGSPSRYRDDAFGFRIRGAVAGGGGLLPGDRARHLVAANDLLGRHARHGGRLRRHGRSMSGCCTPGSSRRCRSSG